MYMQVGSQGSDFQWYRLVSILVSHSYLLIMYALLLVKSLGTRIAVRWLGTRLHGKKETHNFTLYCMYVCVFAGDEVFQLFQEAGAQGCLY